MGTTIIGAGQTLSGTTITAGTVEVTSGGSAVGVTVDGGSLQIDAGGVATGTTVEAGYLQIMLQGNAANTVISGTGSYQLVRSGGVATSTVISDGGSDDVDGGSDIGAIVNMDSSLDVSAGGVATSPVFNSYSNPVLLPVTNISDEGTVNTPTLGKGTELIVSPGYTVTNPILLPGSEIDFAAIAYAADGSASLNSATDVLTIDEGGVATTVQLAGTYAGDSFSLSDDGAFSTFGVGTHGTTVSLNAASAAPTPPPGGGFNGSTGITISSAIPAAQAIATLAHQDIAAVDTITGPGTGVFSAALDSSGDQAIYSTIDTTGHVLSASGTGQSVIAAGSGADTVTVGNGNDLIATGTGSNTVYLVTGDNTLDSEGNDQVYVGAGTDTIALSAESVIHGGDANLFVSLTPGAALTLHTGTGSVQVQGGFGSGGFSGGTDGDNLLVAGTGPTTLYAGGAGDVLVASGGSTTTMDGWSGNETMLGQYSQGTDIFNFNSANVFAVGGAGQNTFNIGSGNNDIVSGQGGDVFNFANGSAGGSTYIADFSLANDRIHLSGYSANQAASALSSATVYQGSEILRLSDNTTISLGHVTGLTQASFT